MTLFRIFGRLAVIAALALELAACGGGGGPTAGTGGTYTPPPSVLSISITPALPAKLTIGLTQSFTATGTYSNGTSSNITGLATWTSSNTAVATITSPGVAKAVGVGCATIDAAYGGVSTSPFYSVTLCTTTAYVTGISVSPATATMGVGQNAQLKATGTYSDGTTADITTSTSWTSSSTTNATVGSTTGLVAGVAPGTATVTGSYYAYNPVTYTGTYLTGTSAITVSNTYTIGGTTTSLPASGVVTLQDNGGDNLTITNSTGIATNAQPYVFNTALAPGSVYNVTIASSVLPAGAHSCTVVDGNGLVSSTAPAVITSAQIICGAAVGTYAGFLANGTASTTGGMVNSATSVPPTQTKFAAPHGLAFSNASSVYVADTSNNMIRLITASDVVSTYAGSGPAGYTNSTTPTLAQFSAPDGVAVDSSNNVYVADTANNVIRLIASSGVVSTLAGATPAQTGGVASPATYVNSTTLSSARFNAPQGVAVDKNGVVYVADTANNLIRVIKPTGVTTLAGGGSSTGTLGGYANGTGNAALFSAPAALVVDSTATYLYVADTGNCVIRQIQISNQQVTTLAGTAPGTLTCGYSDNSSWLAQFQSVSGLALDAKGNLWVADGWNNLLRKITPGGTLNVLSTGTVSTVAGTLNGGALRDGSALPITITSPNIPGAVFGGVYGVAADGAGNVFISDYTYNAIREYTP